MEKHFLYKEYISRQYKEVKCNKYMLVIANTVTMDVSHCQLNTWIPTKFVHAYELEADFESIH